MGSVSVKFFCASILSSFIAFQIIFTGCAHVETKKAGSQYEQEEAALKIGDKAPAGGPAIVSDISTITKDPHYDNHLQGQYVFTALNNDTQYVKVIFNRNGLLIFQFIDNKGFTITNIDKNNPDLIGKWALKDGLLYLHFAQKNEGLSTGVAGTGFAELFVIHKATGMFIYAIKQEKRRERGIMNEPDIVDLLVLENIENKKSFSLDYLD